MGANFRANSAIDLIRPSGLTQDAAVSDLGMAMIEILGRRCSRRDFAAAPLPLYQLSRLLWAAAGYNRDGQRTAPSACNGQETEVYVALEDGLYCYDADLNLLLNVCSEDLRHLTGSQDFVAQAPVNLVYVADLARMPLVPAGERLQMAAFGAGCISQNVSLQCAAEGLATVARALIDRTRLAAAMGLRASQHIVLAQSVGLPGDGAAAGA